MAINTDIICPVGPNYAEISDSDFAYYNTIANGWVRVEISKDAFLAWRYKAKSITRTDKQDSKNNTTGVITNTSTITYTGSHIRTIDTETGTVDIFSDTFMLPYMGYIAESGSAAARFQAFWNTNNYKGTIVNNGTTSYNQIFQSSYGTRFFMYKEKFYATFLVALTSGAFNRITTLTTTTLTNTYSYTSGNSTITSSKVATISAYF